MSARILVVDNYDSFVFNLVQYLYQLGAECEVLRNDEVSTAYAHGRTSRSSAAGSGGGFDGVLLSPGPGRPEEAGVCVDMVRHCAATGVPVFGVCLGMQSMQVAYGGVVGRAPELLHGKTSLVAHDGMGVFAGLPSPFTATRYHSLAAEPTTVPAALQVTARTEDGIVMGLRHRELPVEGVQFHPESVLTEHGHRMLANWLAECGDEAAVARSAGLAPVVGRASA
ncbi:MULTISPECIES: aminodeoxychorismate/anthranilate synthase component II [Streptomyces]|uniref:Aminodeoxychorismate synthase n=2 Tax=Streptomyces griseoaurantiacus TaxID=68213 RepID=F3NK42_9ACTN|nr:MULTISPECIES: aminodeoxychorismate/anthranilate synthase component II [Streptomyces]GHE82834.1 aminodeoxychorismate/anthranilate synthase component II [Streptomyces griseoaurantiacus]EGG46001.1 glutamine amidotransferase [Streptomyces griseoaurantiacus M045]MCF0090962.1 Anthranilate synthase component 2 [Streptomyces sp. MH192]MCF0103426.1 Anthranilate synthase component 2 [Streptomyces sp. MH191]MDX3364387.1 aminodeoxychorismate/anthranilate synthase component II [Streptomyces sp. ME02-697